MTTVWNPHVLPKLADGSLNLANQTINLALLYSYAVPPATAPDDVDLLVVGPGFQELSGSGYARATAPCNTTVSGGVTTVVIGQNYALTLTAPSFVGAGVFYVPGSIAGMTDPWLFITDDMFGNIVTPGAVVGTTASPKKLFSFVPRGGTPKPTPILYEPFNDFTTNGWTASTVTINAAGRTGNGALGTGTSAVDWPIPAGSRATRLVFGFGWRHTSFAAAHPIVQLREGGVSGTNQITVGVGVNGELIVRRGTSAGTIIGQSANGTVVVNTFAYIEVDVTLLAAGGLLTVRVNGVNVIGPLTGLNTVAGLTGIVDDFALASTGTGNATWDDVYLLTGASAVFLGPQSITGAFVAGVLNGTVDVSMGVWVQSPGPSTWESARIQHVYLFPQRVNYIPNPSGEDVGLFGWRSDGTITRVSGGVDSPNNTHLHTTGKILESVAVPTQIPFRFSAYVRGTGTVRLKLMCLDANYAFSAEVAGVPRKLYADWSRYDDILTPAADIYAVIPRIESDTVGLDVDLVLMEAGEALHDYFDGDSQTGMPYDFAWQGIPAQSYSTYYTNRYATAARLFGGYFTGQVTLPSMVLDWVPSGTSIYTHWDVLGVNDTKHPLKDWNPRIFVP